MNHGYGVRWCSAPQPSAVIRSQMVRAWGLQLGLGLGLGLRPGNGIISVFLFISVLK